MPNTTYSSVASFSSRLLGLYNSGFSFVSSFTAAIQADNIGEAEEKGLLAIADLASSAAQLLELSEKYLPELSPEVSASLG